MTTEYVTVSDALDKLGDQLYRILRVTVGSDITANVNLLSALLSANSRIDAALRSRYVLPFDPVPEALAQPAIDLFRYYLLGIMQSAVSPDDRLRYEDAEKFLGRLSRGEDRLDIPGIEEAPALSVTAVAGRTGEMNPLTYDGYLSDIGYDILGPARRC
jgi:phage gp36-like protein